MSTHTRQALRGGTGNGSYPLIPSVNGRLATAEPTPAEQFETEPTVLAAIPAKPIRVRKPKTPTVSIPVTPVTTASTIREQVAPPAVATPLDATMRPPGIRFEIVSAIMMLAFCAVIVFAAFASGMLWFGVSCLAGALLLVGHRIYAGIRRASVAVDTAVLVGAELAASTTIGRGVTYLVEKRKPSI